MIEMDPIARLLGEWSVGLTPWSLLLRIVLSVFLSAVIGCERSSKRHAAGLRTFILVSLASTMAMTLDLFLMNTTGMTFCILSAASVVGVSTITVYSILYSCRSQIKGLTTSAALWTCGIDGLAIGAGWYTAGLIGFFALLASLSIFPTFEKYLKNRSNHFEIHLELKDVAYLRNFVTTIRQLGLAIDDIEFNSAYLHSGLSVYSVSISIGSKELKKYKTHSEIIDALRSLDYIYHIEEMK